MLKASEWPRPSFGGGEQLAGHGLISGSDQHPNTLRLELWLLSSGIVR